MSDKPISNEMADKLLSDDQISMLKLGESLKSLIKSSWRKSGLLEESALEKARKLQFDLLDDLERLDSLDLFERAGKVKSAWEKTVLELEARIKELEENKA